jgi:D-serine deaminase-like pyridoxal phosphate-dependent protein
MRLDDLPTPALVVDLDRLENNIQTMAKHASRLGVRLRPHVKTHKCLQIGRMQLAAGASGITVSTIDEARAFADAGFDDITWAFPLIPSRCAEAVEIARRVELGVLVDSTEAIGWLAATGFPFKTWIKVDCGYGRAGAQPNLPTLGPLVKAIETAGLRFAGLLSHSGNAYDANTAALRAEVTAGERDTMVAVSGELAGAGFAVPDLSTGSTPGTTAADSLEGVTEVRPGNYAFFDRDQLALGSCTETDVALSVISTVVSRAEHHSICDAGALVLSKDPGPDDRSMGDVWSDYDGGRLEADLRVTGLSQEHGKLSAPVPLGTRLRIMPNHSCLTAACFSSMYAVRGDHVEETWKIWNSR